jgi:hypothetical protein
MPETTETTGRMTDAELKGLALQALNMAKRDLERNNRLGCFLASHHAGEGIHRMDQDRETTSRQTRRGMAR